LWFIGDAYHSTKLFLDSDDENPKSSSISMHQSSFKILHTIESILNTSDHMIVDLSPITFQEKGKFWADNLFPEQSGSGNTDDQQQQDEGWQTVTRKKKKTSKKNKAQCQEVLKVMTKHKPAFYQKIYEIMVYDVPSMWWPKKIMNELTLWLKCFQ
jgi:hypothetical protein